MDERVVFSRQDAERIASAVRKVESGNRDEAPLRFTRDFGQGLSFGTSSDRGGRGSAIRLGSFSGDWATGEYKTVTFLGVTSTPNTASVLNLCVPVDADSGTLFVLFSKVKNTAGFVAVELQQPQQPQGCMRVAGYNLTQLPNYSASGSQILGHDGSCLKWYDVSTCPSTAA